MSTAVNKKRAMLSSSFTKQLAIADINLTHAFLEEIKHHWDLFLVPEILQEKLHRVAVSNVDAEVKVGWLKLWNGNRFDKDALYFLKSPFSDSTLDDWLSKSTYWAQLKKKIYWGASKYSFISSLIANRCVYSLRVYPNLEVCGFQFNFLSWIQHNAWDEQPNIDLAMKRVLYMYNLIFTICLFFVLHVLNYHSIFGL